MPRVRWPSSVAVYCPWSLWLLTGCPGGDDGGAGEETTSGSTSGGAPADTSGTDSDSIDSDSTDSDAADSSDGTSDGSSTGDPPPFMAVDDVFEYHEDLFPWAADSPTVLDNDDIDGAPVQFVEDVIATEQGHEVRLGLVGDLYWNGDGAIVEDAFTYTIEPYVEGPIPSSARVELAVRAMTYDVEDLRADGRSTAITLPDGFAFSPRSLGDLDGDGYDDFAVRPAVQTFDVVLRLNGALPSAVELAAGAPGFRVTSALELGAAGDFNGDGIDDLLVRTLSDLSIVFGGVDLTDFSTDVPAGDWGVRIDDDVNGLFNAVRAVGDVDGDGRDDLALDDPFHDLVNGGEGRAIVVFGRAEPGEVSITELEASGGAYSVTARADAHLVGQRVAPAGDVDGDGLADWLLSGHLATDEVAWLIFGTGVRADIDLDVLGNGGFELMLGDDAAGDPFGVWSMSTIGDYDGDGLDDFAVVDAGFDHGEGTDGRGEIVVVWGKADAQLVDFEQLGAHGRTIDIRNDGAPGVGPTAFFGQDVQGLGDVDGDGRDDLGFACYEAGRFNPESGQVGRAYVVLGRERGASVSVPGLSEGDGGFVLVGARDDGASIGSGFTCLAGPGGCELVAARVANDEQRLELIPLAPLASP